MYSTRMRIKTSDWAEFERVLPKLNNHHGAVVTGTDRGETVVEIKEYPVGTRADLEALAIENGLNIEAIPKLEISQLPFGLDIQTTKMVLALQERGVEIERIGFRGDARRTWKMHQKFDSLPLRQGKDKGDDPSDVGEMPCESSAVFRVTAEVNEMDFLAPNMSQHALVEEQLLAIVIVKAMKMIATSDHSCVDPCVPSYEIELGQSNIKGPTPTAGISAAVAGGVSLGAEATLSLGGSHNVLYQWVGQIDADVKLVCRIEDTSSPPSVPAQPPFGDVLPNCDDVFEKEGVAQTHVKIEQPTNFDFSATEHAIAGAMRIASTEASAALSSVKCPVGCPNPGRTVQVKPPIVAQFVYRGYNQLGDLVYVVDTHAMVVWRAILKCSG